MPTQRKVCLLCHNEKGTTGFRKGKYVCSRCDDLLVTGRVQPITPIIPKKQLLIRLPNNQGIGNILPQIGNNSLSVDQPIQVALPQVDNPIIEEKQILSEDKSDPSELELDHLDQCRNQYQEYFRSHPTDLSDGDWVYVIEDDPNVYKAHSHHQAVSDAKERKMDKRWFCTQHWSTEQKKQTEIDRIMAVNVNIKMVTTGTRNLPEYIHATVKVNVSNSYLVKREASVKHLIAYKTLTPTLPHVNTQSIDDLLVDTGATMCIIPWDVAKSMHARAEDRVTLFEESKQGQVAGLGGIRQKMYYLDMSLQIEGLEWHQVRIGCIQDVNDPGVVGMSYLVYCQQIWLGSTKLILSDLSEAEIEAQEKEHRDRVESNKLEQLSRDLEKEIGRMRVMVQKPSLVEMEIEREKAREEILQTIKRLEAEKEEILEKQRIDEEERAEGRKKVVTYIEELQNKIKKLEQLNEKEHERVLGLIAEKYKKK
jgi:gag-polyprotein putative aspartyl protease